MDACVDVPLPAVVSMQAEPLHWRGKYVFDVVASLLLILLLFPLICLGCAIAWHDTGHPLFVQRRLGYRGRPFRFLKFQTMVPDGDRILQHHLDRNPAAASDWAATRKLRVDPRVSALGRLMRKTGMDELPQLVNVLRGEMSLVGPRPIVDDEVGRYGEVWVDYMKVRPGITGLWQVSGRNDTTYEQRVDLDRHYVANCSALLDAKILLLTIPAVFSGKGAY